MKHLNDSFEAVHDHLLTAIKLLGVDAMGVDNSQTIRREALEELAMALECLVSGTEIAPTETKVSDASKLLDNASGFLDSTERNLGAALDECGGVCEGNLEDLPLLTSSLLGAWRNLRFARRELDPTAWARYRATTEGADQ